jgi:hypothetical protein
MHDFMRLLQALAASVILIPSVGWAQDASPPPPQAEVDPGMAPVVTPPPASAAPPPSPEAKAKADIDWSSRPSSGLGLLIAGGIVTGLGLANLATSAPVCHGNAALTEAKKNECTEIALGISGGITGLGVIFLIIGGVQRSGYNDWKQQNGIASHVEVAPLPRGAAAGFRTSF